MARVYKTSRYDRWLKKLNDAVAKVAIVRYFNRVELGMPIEGDIKSVGDKVIEVRFHMGQGYRVYLTQEGEEVVLLLVGGKKSTQAHDIAEAKKLARDWRKEAEHGSKQI